MPKQLNSQRQACLRQLLLQNRQTRERFHVPLDTRPTAQALSDHGHSTVKAARRMRQLLPRNLNRALAMLARIFSVALLLLSTALHAEPAGFRAYQIGQHGTLQLSVPASWNDQMRQRPNDEPPTILLTSEQGYSFNVQLTPLWSAKPDAVIPDAEAIKRTVNKAAEEASNQVTETTIATQEIQGVTGSGYYFRVTDCVPKPAEFKYMTKGMLRVGDLILAFTILSNDSAESAVVDALKMLKGAQQVGAAPH